MDPFLPSVLNAVLTDFQGLHDNGYTTTLSHLQTESLLDKLVFLRGYNEIAYQLRDYRIPECNIPGLFMTQKMPVKQNTRRFAPTFLQKQSSPPFPQSQFEPSFHQYQSGSSFPQSQFNTPFPQPEPSPPYSPPMPATSPFQLMSAPASPAYVPQEIPPISPAPYVDPTLVRARLLVVTELTI